MNIILNSKMAAYWSNNVKVDFLRLAFFVVAFGFGVLGFLYAPSLIHNNDSAVNIIVTVFSILAGFLIAIMTIIGDPGGFLGRSWRANEIGRKNILNRLKRQKWMFYLYLMTLGLILAASLLGNQFPNVASLLERIYLALALAAFVLSLRLPSALMDIQMKRHDEETKLKREKIGLKK